MPEGQTTLWRRLVKGLAGILIAFGFTIAWTLGLWLIVFFGLRYLFGGPEWEGAALIATLFAGLFLLHVIGEGLIEGVIRGLWWGVKTLWRRCRR